MSTPAWKRRLKTTKLGWWFIGMTFGIGVAAINTGNNLLFLVLGMLLASIIVSGILSEQSLRAVRIERRLPAGASAGQPALVGLVARNGKKRAPSFSLELREKGGDIQGRGFLVVLGAQQTAEVAYRFVPHRRGLHRFEQLEVATRAPFGLFEKSRPLDAPAEMVVFPRKVPPPAAQPQALAREGERPEDRIGLGLEVHSLRDHRAGEDARTIHWKSSARHGRLIGVDREQERRRRVCIVVDNRALGGAPLDRAVERAAALVERELDAGAEVSVSVAGRRLPAGSGDTHLREALTLLALLETAPASPPPEPDPQASVIEARP
ncbi:MAG: DUF58 domain-containing protein [Myxococcales bacterium]|nr:DUF58 domain-containing protein [Myxococcales bacterium]